MRSPRNLLIVGTGPRAASIYGEIQRHPERGLWVIGFADEADVPFDPSIPQGMVHKLVDTPDLLREAVIDEVIIACPRSLLISIAPVIASCATAGIPVTTPTDIFGDFFPPPRESRFGSKTVLSFAPVHHSRSMLLAKRGIDVAGAMIGLILAAPLLAVAAAAIKLGSPGPVLSRQSRCGLRGRSFDLLKLRTAYCDAEERKQEPLHVDEVDGPAFEIREDPRATPVGRVLRRYGIDAVPHLWNVLIGDMSLVGPRPPISSEVALYETSQRRRLSMRPGLTCLWQINGGDTLGLAGWAKSDLEYIDGWSLVADFKILANTVLAALRGAAV